MKRLGKKVNYTKETIEAYRPICTCYCGCGTTRLQVKAQYMGRNENTTM